MTDNNDAFSRFWQDFYSSSTVGAAGPGMDALPSWVKCLFASSCFVNSFPIQKAAIATTLDLITLTQTVVTQQVAYVFVRVRSRLCQMCHNAICPDGCIRGRGKGLYVLHMCKRVCVCVRACVLVRPGVYLCGRVCERS